MHNERVIRAAVTTCTGILTEGMRQEGCGPGDAFEALLELNISVIAYILACSHPGDPQMQDLPLMIKTLSKSLRKIVPNIVAQYEKDLDNPTVQ